MSSIFAPAPDGFCGIFAESTTCGSGRQEDVVFLRAHSLLVPSAPVQNLAGEVLLSFVALPAQRFEVQPLPAGFTRMQAGQLVKVEMLLIRFGTTDAQEGDRCTLKGKHLETVNALDLGDHWEVELQHVGR